MNLIAEPFQKSVRVGPTRRLTTTPRGSLLFGVPSSNRDISRHWMAEAAVLAEWWKLDQLRTDGIQVDETKLT